MDTEDLKKFIEEKNEELARLVKSGFDGVDKKFEDVDQKFENIDQKFDKIDQKFDSVDLRFNSIDNELSGIHAINSSMISDISYIKDNVVTRTEFEDLSSRVSTLSQY